MEKMQHTLENLGWDASYVLPQTDLLKENTIARVSAISKDTFSVVTVNGEEQALLTKQFYKIKNNDFPVVGDWVLIESVDGVEKCIINEILPRKNFLSRKVSGKQVKEQIMASNIDYAFIVQGDSTQIN